MQFTSGLFVIKRCDEVRLKTSLACGYQSMEKKQVNELNNADGAQRVT